MPNTINFIPNELEQSSNSASKKFFQFFIVILSMLCFYFSINECLFDWFGPDELAAIASVKRRGLIECSSNYYFNTTINRLSAAFGVCALAKNVLLFNSKYFGLILSRACYYFLIPFSVAVFLRHCLKIKNYLSYTLAFVTSSIAFFIISTLAETQSNIHADSSSLFGLDLAIYAMGTISYFLTMGLFFKSFKNNLYFTFFALCYAINLNSHEVFLITGGFIIVIYGWCLHKELVSTSNDKFTVLKTLMYKGKIATLLLIEIVSGLVTTLANGVKMRQETWPSDGSIYDGLSYLILSLEEVIYSIFQYALLAMLLLALGFIFRARSDFKYTAKNAVFFWLILSIPIFYLVIVAYLIGITPSLHIPPTKSAYFAVFDNYLSPLISSKKISAGALAMRQNLFLYITLYVNIFLTGFLVAPKFRSLYKLIQRYHTENIITAIVVTILFISHPLMPESINILQEMLKEKHYRNNFSSLNSTSFLRSKFSHFFFPTNRSTYHTGTSSHITLDRTLQAGNNQRINLKKIEKVHKKIDENEAAWLSFLYNVSFIRECNKSTLNPALTAFTCQVIYGETKLNNLLKTRVFSMPWLLNLNIMQGLKLSKSNSQLRDEETDGEHFIATEIKLSKGLHYFIVETAISNTDLYIYLIGEKTCILFPWSIIKNAKSPTSYQFVYTNNEQEHSIEPLFVQQERSISLNKERFFFVVNNHTSQKMFLRIQQGHQGATVYKGLPIYHLNMPIVLQGYFKSIAPDV